MKKSILFFTGGTALREIASEISKDKDIIMTNIITAFDSGGSSAEIRKEFDILAIGDIRNRMISLLNNQNSHISDFLKYRFRKTEDNLKLKSELEEMINLNHFLIKKLPQNFQIFFSESLKLFNENLSGNFNFKDGSIGNFIITGNYLLTKNIYETIDIIKNLLNLKDIIIPVTDQSLHIGATLENNNIILGQHNITSKQKCKSRPNIKEIFLIKNIKSSKKINSKDFKVHKDLKDRVENSDLIIYSIGSFYSSLLSNFLINKVGDSIKNNNNKKVYIPNTFFDSELNNRTLSFQVTELLKYLKAQNSKDYLNYILIDENHNYPFELDFNNLAKDIKVIKKDIINMENYPKLSAKKIIKELKDLIS